MTICRRSDVEDRRSPNIEIARCGIAFIGAGKCERVGAGLELDRIAVGIEVCLLDGGAQGDFRDVGTGVNVPGRRRSGVEVFNDRVAKLFTRNVNGPIPDREAAHPRTLD